MWFESHGCRRTTTFPGTLPHPVDDLHMPAMEAVEVAQRQNGIVPAWGRIVGIGGEVHALQHQLQSIVREGHAFGKPFIGCGMPKVVSHVSEVGSRRRYPSSRFNRLRQRKVGWMRPLSQRVDHG